jgi:RsiW-degrading membrane proteinase PrsW (M82 family)
LLTLVAAPWRFPVTRTLFLFALATGLVLFLTNPALAGAAPDAAAFGSYIDEFLDYWRERAKKQNSIVVGILLLGVVALLIITGVKKPK